MARKRPQPPGTQPSSLLATLGLGTLVLCGASFRGQDGLRGQDGVSSGRIETKSTWSCMGISWHVQGDDNRNASVATHFRRSGTEEWKPALELWRHEFEETRMFSGSVFRLAPGTAYEFRLRMNDPDGGSVDRIVTANTLEVPRMPRRMLDVRAGGLVEAQKLAAPGIAESSPSGGPGQDPISAFAIASANFARIC